MRTMSSEERCCELAIWLTTPALGGAGLEILGVGAGAVLTGACDGVPGSGRATGGRAKELMLGLAMPILVGRGIEGLGRAIDGDMGFEADDVTPGGGGGELAGGYAVAPLLC